MGYSARYVGNQNETCCKQCWVMLVILKLRRYSFTQIIKTTVNQMYLEERVLQYYCEYPSTFKKYANKIVTSFILTKTLNYFPYQ